MNSSIAAHHPSVEPSSALRSHILGSDDISWTLVSSLLKQLISAQITSALSQSILRSTDDPEGREMLMNMLSKDPPIDVIQDFLNVFPYAVHINVFSLFQPRHNYDPNIVRRLFQAFRAQENELPGQCPYTWITLPRVSVEVAEVIIDEYPAGVLQTFFRLRNKISVHSHSLLGRPCPQRQFVGVNLLDREIFFSDHLKQPPQWWDKLLLMLKAAERGTDEEATATPYPIHALMRRIAKQPLFLFSREVSQRVLSLVHHMRLKHPILFRSVDRDGDAPLQIFLRSTTVEGLCFGFTPALPCPCVGFAPALITILVDSFGSSAALLSDDDRLPLHIALATSCPCHDTLLSKAPASVSAQDPVSRLYPFQLAASVATPPAAINAAAKVKTLKVDAYQLTVIYTLLRMDPSLATGGAGQGNAGST